MDCPRLLALVANVVPAVVFPCSFIQLDSLLLVAQQQGVNPGPDRPWWFNLIPMVLIFMVAYFMLILPERKKQEKLEGLQKVKEKDRIVTSGGIFGVVTNVQRDAGRVTVRIDENTGTKIKISLGAVAQILGDEEPS